MVHTNNAVSSVSNHTVISVKEFTDRVNIADVGNSHNDEDNFRNVEIAGLTVENKKLQRSEFNYSFLSNMTFNDIDFKGSEFQYAVLENVVFNRCQLNRSSFDFASMNNVHFNNCTMSGSSFDFVSGNASFASCILEHAELHNIAMDITMTQCSGTGLELNYSPGTNINADNCDFHNGEFKECTLSGAMKNCVLTEADFNSSNCCELSLENCSKHIIYSKNAKGLFDDASEGDDDDLDFDFE